ncbi:septin-1 isoform X2 [Sciurus carolinensis]|uniref:septin-1 isoform X2 n=1 Tax=Sciurus carolinensis TaxID=30640 RepID=UPI001FB4F16F|nr:septin-1 isoform X2 [Sciurus carolinensis]
MDKEYVGFAALPNQLHRKSVKKGFDFTLMVAGESGLGKSTLINSLFLTNLYEDRQVPEASARLTQTLTIERRGVEIEEGGIKVKLTLVDTPGFGDSVDCSDCWLPVVRFIEEQFEQYLRDESGLNRKNIQDSRVHCCLYFISPFGRGLRPLDVAFLRAVHEKVNIIPVIGKADALMPMETQALKQKIRDQLKEEEINIYQFPECDSDEDEDFKRQDAEMKGSIPFAVVGSCEVVRDGGTRPVRGRRYAWGTVEVENPHHCDFLNLRRMLVQTHLQDLKEVTHDLLYEGYRARCLQSLARPGARDRASRSKLSRQSATEIPLPMLPLAETEKLIREKDEEITHPLPASNSTHPSIDWQEPRSFSPIIRPSLLTRREKKGARWEDPRAGVERRDASCSAGSASCAQARRRQLPQARGRGRRRERARGVRGHEQDPGAGRPQTPAPPLLSLLPPARRPASGARPAAPFALSPFPTGGSGGLRGGAFCGLPGGGM